MHAHACEHVCTVAQGSCTCLARGTNLQIRGASPCTPPPPLAFITPLYQVTKQYCLGMMSSLIPEPKSGCNISEGFNGMRGHVGNRSPVLRAPETLPSGRAAVSLFWPNSTVSANRKHSLQNFQALLGGARSSCRGLGAYGASFTSIEGP